MRPAKMLLFLAIIGYLSSAALAVLIGYANMMSDAPGVRESFAFVWFGLAISTLFVVGWWFS